MAVAYQKYGSSNTIVTKQSSAAAETITIADPNGGNSYSVLGAFVNVIAGAGGANLTINIAGSDIGTAQSAASAGTFIYQLSSTFSALQGLAGDDITIVTSGAVQCQVHLILSQFEPSNA